jgi:L-ascorbate oxidase
MKGKDQVHESNPQLTGPGENLPGRPDEEKTASVLDRRGFIAAGMGAAAATAIIGAGDALAQQNAPPTPRPTPTPKPKPRPIIYRPYRPVASFPQPISYESNNKVLDVNLTVSMLPNQVRAYNGNVPGPTLKVKAGDQLKVTLANQLPANPPPPQPSQGGSLDYCGKPNEMGNPHCFNSTNLHTHGLHVSPMSIYGNGSLQPPTLASDDVLVQIAPGQTQKYCIEIPSFHAPGTNWYHSHMHGSTALQLANGLCGALIVEEGPGDQIVPYAHKDYVFLMQEIIPGGNAQTIYTQAGASTSTFYINGQNNPKLTMLKNEVQRWRFINATGTPRGLAQITLLNSSSVAQTMYQVAMDGISFYGKAPVATTALNLGAGGRSDLLIKISQPGTYKLMKNPYPWSGGQPTAQLLATITVLNSYIDNPLPATIPGTAPAYCQPIINFTPNAQTAVFSAGSYPASCPAPAPSPHPAGILPGIDVINCKEYMPPLTPDAPPNPTWDQFMPTLGTSEQWVLQNLAGSAHPFHLHVNPFQVEHMKIDPNGPDDATNWMFVDTIPLLLANVANPPPWLVGGKIKIRTRYADYYGRFVTHCHILVHEDLGMMANVYVKNNGSGIGPCVKI